MTELADFCDRLGRLRAESGNPTLVWLSGQPLCPSKSQLSKIFRGQVTGLPDADVVRGIVAACVRWAKRYGHAPVLPTDERHWLIERDIVERRIGEPRRPAQGGCTLPRDLATFTGRGADLAALLVAVNDPGTVQIHAVDGMPGVGKTALAVHAAHRLAPEFPDGQFFVDLRGHARGQRPVEPDDALQMLLLAAGVDVRSIPNETEARAALWRDRMSGRRALVLLDNARTEEQVRLLLPNAPRCLVLVTSRHRLAALPDARTCTLDVLEPAQAEELLRRLTGRRDTEPSAAAEITRLCGYLPLAISLLAGRLRSRPMWTFRHLADRIAATLTGHADQLGEFRAGHSAVSAAFELSYQDLTEDARRLFRRLALHPGTEFDAVTAASLDDEPVPLTATRLEGLYDDHLLIETAPGRYSFHDLIRRYAADLAVQDAVADRDAAVARLLGHYTHTAYRASRALPSYLVLDPAPSGTPPPSTVEFSDDEARAEWWSVEHANLQACLRLAGNQPSVLAAELLVRLYPDLRLRGRYSEAVRAYRAVLTAAELPALLRAHLCCRLGVLEYLISDFAEAQTHLLAARADYLTHGEQTGTADARYALGVAQNLSGDHVAAIDTLNAALEGYAELGSRSGQATVLDQLGRLYRTRSQFGLAGDCFDRAHALHAAVGNTLGEADALCGLGVVERQRGDFVAAIEHLGRANAAYVAFGSRIGEANALNSLGIVQHMSGGFGAAMENLVRARTLYSDIGNRLGAAVALNGVAIAHRRLGAYSESLRLCRLAHVEFTAIDNEHGVASNRTDIGIVQRLLGDLTDAAHNLDQAHEFYVRHAMTFPLGEMLDARGLLELAAGDLTAAAGSLHEALAHYREAGSGHGVMEVRNSLGELELARGDVTAARHLHDAALRTACEIGARPEQARAHEGIGRALRGTDAVEALAHLRVAWQLYTAMGAPQAGPLAVLLAGSATR